MKVNMSGMTYYKMISLNNELLQSNLWSFQWNKLPNAGYNPGEIIFDTRIKSVEGIEEPQPTRLQYDIRGYPVSQAGPTTIPLQSVTITFLDYEDSSILYFLRKWRDIQAQWDSFVANRIRNYIASASLFRLDKEWNVMRSYKLERMFLESINYPDTFTGEAGLIGDNVSGTFSCLVLQEMNNLGSNQ